MVVLLGFREGADGVGGNLDKGFVVAVVTDALVGLVHYGVVRRDEVPAAMVGAVGVGAMQQIAVEENGVSGIEFQIDKRETRARSFDVLGIGHGLFVNAVVIDAAHHVRTFEDLQAAVFACSAIDGNEATQHAGNEAA